MVNGVTINGRPFYADSSVLSYEFNPADHAGQNDQSMYHADLVEVIVVMVDDNGLSIDSSSYQERTTPPEGPRRVLPRNRQ